MFDALIAPVTSLITAVINRIIPDPQAAQAAKLQLLQLMQDGTIKQLVAETDLAKAQDAINQAEATNTSIFVAGWRPFIGWCCGIVLAFNYIAAPLASWVALLLGAKVSIPTLSFSEIQPVLYGMLGLGAMRTVEKVNGIKAGQ